MQIQDVIIALIHKLKTPVGRHLYGVLGTYDSLADFQRQLKTVTMSDGSAFPEPISLTDGILNTFNDDEFRDVVEKEAKYPEPTKASVQHAFEAFLKSTLNTSPLLILKDLELVFAYNIDLAPLRTYASDHNRVLLLLPGRRNGPRIEMYPQSPERQCQLPGFLIADDHLWEI